MDGYSFLRRIMAIFERRVGVLYAVVIVTSLLSEPLLAVHVRVHCTSAEELNRCVGL
jgi:hypothetical protein